MSLRNSLIESKKKIYVAVCGLVDSGKSTFIKTVVKLLNWRDIPVDTLCDETENGKTIRSAQIVLKCNDEIDFVLLDCPGHIEYLDEIRSCLSKAHFVIHVIDDKRREASIDYINKNIIPVENEFGISGDCREFVYSHSTSKEKYHYDVKSDIVVFQDEIALMFKEICEKLSGKAVNPADTARRIVDSALKNGEKACALCSFGKDSIALLDLLRSHPEVDVWYGCSGYDMDGINEKFISEVEKFFGRKIRPFRILPEDQNEWNFENKSVHELTVKKAELLNKMISENGYKYVLSGIRRDEEGTRSKEKFFSLRDNSGAGDLYKSQLEIFGDEHNGVSAEDGRHVRVNSLLDMTETDVWLYTRAHELPICSEYFAADGKRYRSLGDKPITSPIKSNARTLDEIIDEVDQSLVGERFCRQKQDGCEKYAMEKFRSVGFF